MKNDEAARQSRPASQRDPVREYQADRLVGLADFPSIPCLCPAHLGAPCKREGRCQSAWVSLDDFLLDPREPLGPQ